LRAALRRIVDSIWLLVVPRGQDRICAIQVWFAGGKRHRDYLMLARRNGQWGAWSLAAVTVPADLDLRRQADAAALEAELQNLDPARLLH
jgi:hypothetical protein